MFSDDFKDRVFKVCLPTGLGGRAVYALEKGSHTLLRYVLEDLLDDFELYEDENQGSNRKVRFDKVHTFEDRQSVYSELMELITNKIDNGELLPEYRVRF